MNVEGFFSVFFGFFNKLFDLLHSYTLSAFGVDVPLLTIFGALLVLSMIVSLFWKGARG